MADEWVRPPEVDSGRRSSPVGGGGPSIPAHLFFFPFRAVPGLACPAPGHRQARPRRSRDVRDLTPPDRHRLADGIGKKNPVGTPKRRPVRNAQ